MVYEASTKFSGMTITTTLHRASMARLLVVLLISVVLNFRRCQSSIGTLKLQNEQNSESLDQTERDNRDMNQNSQNEMTTMAELANGQSTLADNSQLSLIRPSRTLKHKWSCPFNSKCKHGSNSFHHFKRQKFGLLPQFLKHCSVILKSFMLEIEKVLNWWHVAVEKLKGKIEQKQVTAVSTKKIETMHAQFPTIKNKIRELMAFFSKIFHLNGPHYFHDPSNRISIDINKSLKKIKQLASSFVMFLKESEHMNTDFNNKLTKVKGYFDSIPTDHYAILDHGLINGHKETGINENIDINFDYNEEVDILKSQTHMLEIMWDYINKLPDIFTVILEIIGQLHGAIDWESSSFNDNRPNYTPKSHIFDSHSLQKFHDGLYTKSFTNHNNPQKEVNAQLDCTKFDSMCNIYGNNLVKKQFHPPSNPTQDWVRAQIVLEKNIVLSLLGSGSQLTIGDIVILHLTDSIILVGRVDNNVNPIIFNIIYHKVAQKQSYTHGTTIWNVSYQHLSDNSPIYNYIMSRIESI